MSTTTNPTHPMYEEARVAYNATHADPPLTSEEMRAVLRSLEESLARKFDLPDFDGLSLR